MEEELKQIKTQDYINNLIDSYQEQVHTPRTDSPDSYAAKNWWNGFCFAIDAAVNICSSRESDGSHVPGEDVEELMKQLQKGLVYSEEWGKRKQMEKTCLSAEQTMQIVFNQPINPKKKTVLLSEA